MSGLCLLATLTSVVKGDHVYRSGVRIGEKLSCELEPGNSFNVRGNAVQILREGTIIGHLPDSLAEKVARMISNNLIELIECEITGKSIPAPEGVWVQGGWVQGGGGGYKGGGYKGRYSDTL